MELFFKKYFWVVNLVFIFLVALLAARTVNLFVGFALSPITAPEPARVVERTRAQEKAAPLDVERTAGVFGIQLPKEPEIVEPSMPTLDLTSAPVKSSLRVKLLGTLLAGLKEWSIASIQDAQTLRAQTYFVGDRIQGAEVLEIERTQVIILNNGRREFINNEAGDGSAPPPVVSAPPPAVAQGDGAPPPSSNIGAGIRSTSENEYEVPRQEIDKTLSNLNDVAMQARIVPAFKDGVAQGFKLFSIRPDSIYTKIGINNGDVIKRINGFDLNSPEKALEIYAKLKESSRIDIEIERNGKSVRKTYNVR